MDTPKRDIRSVRTLQVLDGSFRNQLYYKTCHKYLKNTNVSLREYETYRDTVRKIHLDYLSAGANVIRTNTFEGALPIIRKKCKMSVSHYGEIIQEAVKRAREAIDIHVERANVKKEDYWVLGSCGSVTACRYHRLENLTKKICKEYHRDRIQMLLEAKVDGLAFESIDSEVETKALLELLEEFPNARAYMSFRSHDGYTLLDNSPLLYNISYCCGYSKKLFGIGITCIEPTHILRILSRMTENKYIETPIVLCLNNYRWCKDPSIFESIGFINPALDLMKYGVRYIGGGCCTFPDDIRAIRQEIN